MSSAAREMPWNEIANEDARSLVATSDHMSRIFSKALDGVNGSTIPDFNDRKWRYEFCIFTMFWFWYVANSPKFARAEVTKPLLDAYHRGCYEAFLEARLIGDTREALRQWEDDLEAKFLAYKDAYDTEFVEKQKDPHLHALNITGRGSVGWLLVHHLFPGRQPDSRLVLLLNEFGLTRFTGLVEMFNTLEEQYSRSKTRWKFWK